VRPRRHSRVVGEDSGSPSGRRGKSVGEEDHAGLGGAEQWARAVRVSGARVEKRQTSGPANAVRR
jgi:hypothetical protein